MATEQGRRYILGMVHVSKLDPQSSATSLAVDELGLTPEQKAALLQSIAQEEAQYQSGEAISGAEVLAWIRSWGSENPLPFPASSIKQS